ncbi:MAG: HAMP domain-containing sensor histidine kinase [Tissierellia bacterium]|nr:HAMP domain-containing sensor histidine kinase [Tissierellia bacterium]
MKNSVGKRLVKSFLLIILITVTAIDIGLILGFRYYYYNNVENELTNRLELSLDFFRRDYPDKSIEDILIDDNDVLWAHTNAEVQMLNEEGIVMMDSIGVPYKEPIKTNDIIAAKNGEIKSWVGKSPATNGSIMAVSGAITNETGQHIGFLRFISSLQEADRAIIKASLILLIMTALVTFITGIVSLILSRSIIRPIKELTDVARKMADGQYKVRANIWADDEIGQLASTLNTMSEEILKKDQIKNDFISSISHELRTPLTSIKGWAVVLKDAKPEEEDLISDGLSIIENESDRLSKMVEDLLDFSRYISGRIQLDKDAFNIAQTCIDVSKQMKPRAESNKVDFEIDLYEDIQIVVADENRIRQLLINLIDNAIKFTSEKGWVKFQSYCEDNQFIMIVSDNGVGINKEDLLHVKEKFYKGKHSKSHSGIGLSISDEIAKLHNGTLEIFSEENIGTTVKVMIPFNNEEDE